VKYVIGLDAGGSKTLALLVDENGTVAARVRVGGANPRSLGREHAAASLREALAPLLSAGDIRAICVGAAGMGRESDHEFFKSEVRALAGQQAIILLRNDAQIALRAGTKIRPAMVVIAGTGSLVYGETAQGSGERCGGYGALIGDAASAYASGLAAIKHCAHVLDGLDEPTQLSTAVLAAVNAGSVPELIERVHHWPPDVGAIAALAPLIGDAAGAGDPAAQTIVRSACESLQAQVRLVAARVRTESELPVVISGGAFDAVPDLLTAARAGGETTGPCAVLRLALEPAHGAALLALEAAELIQTPP
jgi:N-acetylglucosamine kinase-like BadF-type ATPase